MARRRGVRFTGKFYMLLALMLVAVTVAVVLLLSDSGGGTLETGTMRMELAVKGIVIRDEMSVTVDKYDKVMFQAAEGAESYEGMPIARVFKWGYSDDMMQSLITVETQIYEAQTALLFPDSSPCVLPGGVEVLLGGHAVLLFKGAEKVVVTAKAAGLVHLGDGQPLLDEGAAAV